MGILADAFFTDTDNVELALNNQKILAEINREIEILNAWAEQTGIRERFSAKMGIHELVPGTTLECVDFCLGTDTNRVVLEQIYYHIFGSLFLVSDRLPTDHTRPDILALLGEKARTEIEKRYKDTPIKPPGSAPATLAHTTS